LKSLCGVKVKMIRGIVYVKSDSTFLHELPRLIGQTNNEILSFHRLGRSLENVFIKALEEKRHEVA